MERGECQMNHDYTHCDNVTDDCPRDCFYKQLDEDLRTRTDLDWLPISFGKIDCAYKGDATLKHNADSAKRKQLRDLKTMLEYERSSRNSHLGATLTHWAVNGVIDIDADALQVLVDHYSKKGKKHDRADKS